MRKMNTNIYIYIYKFCFEGCVLEGGVTSCSAASVHIYCTTLHHAPQERSHHLRRQESFLIKFRYSL